MSIFQKWSKQYAGIFPQKYKFLSWLIPAIVVLLIVLFIGLTVFKPNQKESTSSTQLQKSVVSRGEIVISATGTGELVTTDEISLSFPIAGEVTEVDVAFGDEVSIGDVLAAQSNTVSLEANVATAKLDVLNAQQAIDKLKLNAELTLLQAKQSWLNAQDTYDDALEAYEKKDSTRCTTAVIANYQTEADRDAERLTQQTPGSEKWLEIKAEYDQAVANVEYCSSYTDLEKQEIEATYEIAKIDLAQKEEAYNTLDENDGLDPDQLTLLQAKLDNAQIQLESAQEKLDGMTLVAPIDGTVSAVNGQVGDIVSTNTFITIVNMDPMTITAYIDENDLDIVEVGEPATIVFDSFPNVTLIGTVALINPELQTMDQYNVVEVTINVDNYDALMDKVMPIGMSATVEIIQDSIEDALMVPVESLYALDDEGSYGVLVADGSENGTMTPVTVGLTNGTFIQILDGLEEGDTIYVDWFNYQYQS
jgi:RND family efflux transporter MFP subunit